MDLRELLIVQFVKILAHILIWQIAAEKNTVHRSILGFHTIKRAIGFAFLQELIQSCICQLLVRRSEVCCYLSS